MEVDLATGRLRWTSAAKVEGRPAIGGRTIYAPVPTGVIALDATSGHELGRFRLPGAPEIQTADTTAVAVLSDAAHGRLLGFRDDLKPRWQREFVGSWSRPEDIGHGTILVWGSRSSENVNPPRGELWLPSSAVVALDAASGNAVAATDGVEDYVGRDDRTLWFSVVDGGLKSLALNTNTHRSIHNSIVRGAVRVEGTTAVAVIAGHLMKISLPDGRQERLHVDGRWVGGPSDVTIFVAREDGTYAQRLNGDRPIRLVTNTSSSRFLTATGKSAYFATNDGSIVVADLAGLTPTTRLKTDCWFVRSARSLRWHSSSASRTSSKLSRPSAPDSRSPRRCQSARPFGPALRLARFIAVASRRDGSRWEPDIDRVDDAAIRSVARRLGTAQVADCGAAHLQHAIFVGGKRRGWPDRKGMCAVFSFALQRDK